MSSICRSTSIAILLIGATAALTAADDPKPDATIVPILAPGNVFGGQESEFQFRITVSKAIMGRVVWRLAAGTATVAAGEVDLTATPDAGGKATIKLPIPPVKDGVVFAMKLAVSAIETGQNKPAAIIERDIFSFPKDPFFGRDDWLKKLKISVYDPPARTTKLLTAASVPFEEIRTIEALAAVREGFILIGEGTSFKDERGLAATLDKMAGAGLTILCLAPADGEVIVPGLAGPQSKQQELTFRRGIVRKLDKRLNPDGWAENGKTVASTIAVKASTGAVVGEVTPMGGWPWVEATYDSRSRWAVCGLAVIANWEKSPTPRFLFVRMLEHLTENERPTETKKENDR